MPMSNDVMFMMIVFIVCTNFVSRTKSKNYNLRRENHNYISNDSDRTMNDNENNSTQKLPQVIIIGVKKAGTRALLEYLRLHPLVKGPGPEIHFFDRHYHLGLEWYRKQLPATTAEQLTIEKTPCYFIRREVPSRVYKMSPNIKLLVVVRDPVTRAISDFTQSVTKKSLKKTFAETVFLNGDLETVDVSRSTIRIGFYAKHLKKWLKYFPINQIHFVSGENLASEPYEEMRRVEQFLNLPAAIKREYFRFNSTKGFPCIIRKKRSTTTTSNNIYRCLGKTKGRPHAYVERRAIERLRSFYRPFNDQFFAMVKRDFGWNSLSIGNKIDLK